MKTSLPFLILIFLFLSCSRSSKPDRTIGPATCNCTSLIMSCQVDCESGHSNCLCGPLFSAYECPLSIKTNNNAKITLTAEQAGNCQELIKLIENDSRLSNLQELKSSLEELYTIALTESALKFRDSISIAVVKPKKIQSHPDYDHYRGRVIYGGTLPGDSDPNKKGRLQAKGVSNSGMPTSQFITFSIVKPDILADKMLTYEQKEILNDWLQSKGSDLLFTN